MANRIGFTNYGSSSASSITNVEIDNSTNVTVASISAENLTASSAVKTDANKKLISSKQNIPRGYCYSHNH